MEDYVRPPLIAVEPVSPTTRRWRLRVTTLLLLIVLGVVIFFVVRAVTGAGEDNPGVGGQPSSTVTVVPRS